MIPVDKLQYHDGGQQVLLVTVWHAMFTRKGKLLSIAAASEYFSDLLVNCMIETPGNGTYATLKDYPVTS